MNKNMKKIIIAAPAALLITVSSIALVSAQVGATGSVGTTGAVNTGGVGVGVNTGVNAGVNTRTNTGTNTGTGIMNNTGMTPSGSSTSTGATMNNTTSVTAPLQGVARGVSTGNMTGAKVSTGSGNWDAEDQYWRNNFSSRSYGNGQSYDAYAPAYRYGVNTYNRNSGKKYEDLDQNQLRNSWMQSRGSSTLTWEQAEPAIRDSYNRVSGVGLNSTTNSTTTTR